MIPQFPEFKKLELSDRGEVESFTRKFPPYSDFNFVSMWSWDTQSEMGLSMLNGNLVIRFNDYLSKEPFYSFVGLDSVDATIDTITGFSVKNGFGSKIRLVPEEVIECCKSEEFIAIADQDNFDYIYDIGAFCACEGRKYETQRNQINRFERNHPNARVEVFRSFDTVKEPILRLEQRWKLNKIIKDKEVEFRSESAALWRMFDLTHDNFLTVCVFVGDELVGFCVNELLGDSEYAISHFAKADVNYPGIYSYLLHENCRALLQTGKKYLNYEQDLGLPHLRNSKTSFRPVKFLKKHIVIKQ